ncbi:MAG: aspartate aminotransferase family protein [Rhodobacteraceae bacterium]|nr:aspartate aminotransferase family protein [Paracoccaceae bacterium]
MMSHIFGRSTGSSLPRAVKGDGPYIIDETGKRYLDGSGGAAVSCLGHSDQSVRAAMHAQLDQLAFAHTGFFTSDPAEELADLLIAQAPPGLSRVYLVSGGSEAVEAAIKLARQYFLEIGEPERHHIISRRQSYHGNTLGALAAGGNAQRRAQFQPLLIETSQIAPCFEYRDRGPDETVEAYGLRVANELETQILTHPPGSVMCFIAEPVVGASLGAVTATPGYFKRIREICDQYGVLLILDEVMCGMGRTGTLFGATTEGISPDITTIAKGLGAGYQPIGAMLCQGFIYDAVSKGSGFFQHGHTYMGHALATAASAAVLKTIAERGLLDNVRVMGAALHTGLQAEFGHHPHIGDIRGRGLFQAIELVRDCDTKEPFDPGLKLAASIKQHAFEAGLICYPGTGTVDGLRGDHILLAPPFIIDQSHVDELISKLSKAVEMALPKV